MDIRIVVSSSICVVIIFLYGFLVNKKIKNIFFYIFIFILLLASQYLFSDECPSDIKWHRQGKYSVACEFTPESGHRLTNIQRQKIAELYHEHYRKGTEDLKKSEEKCLNLPNANLRDRLKSLIRSAIAGAVATLSEGITAGAITFIFCEVGEYSINYYQATYDIQYYLAWSRWHFHVCEYYQNVLFGNSFQVSGCPDYTPEWRPNY